MFPTHIALTIEHNPGATCYENVRTYLAGLQRDRGEEALPEFPSPEERAKAEETNSLWVVNWHPSTPVGSNEVAAATLEVALAFARTYA